MILNYLALFVILTVLVILFYTFIYIHELPYEAAKHRNHPQQEAIYVACWLSLFTLHAIWPLVYIWALSHKGDHRSIAGQEKDGDQMSEFENRLTRLEKFHAISTNGSGAT